MTKKYKEQSILARRIAGEIAAASKDHAEAEIIISLIKKQFVHSEIRLMEYAVGRMGDKVEMPQTDAQGKRD